MIVIGFAAAILVPAVMIFWGMCLRKAPPAYLQGRFSFRTKRARKNEEIWNYSNNFFAHMILTAGVNCGLVSIVFYIGSAFLTGGEHWAAASLSLLCVQAVCVLLIYRITDFIIGKTYAAGEDDDSDSDSDAGRKTDDTENR